MRNPLLGYLRIALTCAVVAAGVVSASAQYFPSNKVRENDGLSRDLVVTGLYVFKGNGNNSVLRLSANGLMLVDGKLPGSYDDLVARVEKTSRQPIRVLILTDTSEASAANAVQFLKDGTVVVLQQNLAEKFVAQNFEGKTPRGLVTYDRDYQIRMGGVDAHLMHFGSAYTNGDTVVYFPNLKIVAVGNLYSAAPNPNFADGASLVQWSSVLGQVLRLDFDSAVPAQGPAVSKTELQLFKAKLDRLTERAKRLVNDGVPRDQLMSRLKTDDLGWKLNFTPEQLNHFYSELSHPEQSESGK